MIAHIQGRLSARGSETCVVEAGGVGYEIHLSQPGLAALPVLGETVKFYTHHHVREDAQTLYGFSREDEKRIFLLIMTVKGVGPKLGLGILSQMPPGALIQALLKRDLAALTRLPGVGKKLAERLAVELSDKAKAWAMAEGLDSTSATGAWPAENSDLDQAVTALQALGVSSQQAKLAVERAYQRLGKNDVKIEDIVRAALKFI